MKKTIIHSIKFMLMIAVIITGVISFHVPSLAATENENIYAHVISLNTNEIITKTGAKNFTLKVTLDGKTARGDQFIWTSSDTEVVTVKNGLLSFKKAGYAEITVQYLKDGEIAGDRCAVYVIGINEEKATLNKGDTLQLEVLGVNEKITWKTSNPAIALVDPNGLVTPVGYGKAKITATYNKTSVFCEVVSNVCSLKLNKNEIKIKGSKKNDSLSAKVSGPSKTIQWTSSDESVVSVNNKGKLTYKGPGRAVITAEANGEFDTCTVQIANITRQTATLNEGESITLKIEGVDETPIWTSSNKKIAEVDDSGTVTPKGYGKATITGKADGVSFKCVITSTMPSIELSKTELLITGSSKSGSLSAKVTGPQKTVKWSSSNEEVVKIDNRGKMTYIGGGEAEITAEANGKTAKCIIKIVNLNKSDVMLNNGETVQLKLIGTSNTNIEWKSSNKKIAVVDENGLVTSVGYGKTSITAKTMIDDKTKTFTCKITSNTSSINFKKDVYTFTTQTSSNINVEVSGKNKNVIWTSSNTEVAEITGDTAKGKLVIKNGGKTVITATANGKTAECIVMVIRLNKTNIELNEGEAQQLLYLGVDEPVTWKSSNKDVVNVSEEGLVTPVGYGTATVTATSGKNKATCKVVSNVASIKLNETDIVVGEICEVQLKATVTGLSKEVRWASDNESVATVDQNGFVNINEPGTANITATANGKTATCRVTMTALNAEEITLNQGQTFTLCLNGVHDTINMFFMSYDTAIATVDEYGVIRPVGYGETVISLTYQGIEYYCRVKSTIPGLVLDNYTLQGYVGQSQTIKATYTGPAKPAYSWKSSNTSVATVTGGKITFKSPGEAEITVTAASKTAVCKVTVLEAVTEIKEETVTIGLGDSWQLQYEIKGKNTTGTWKSSNMGIATVSNGLIYGKKVGTCTITLTANGKSDTVNVIIEKISNDTYVDNSTMQDMAETNEMNYHDRCYRKWFLQYHAV